MPVILHETVIQAAVLPVWMFFMDPVKNLPAISPPGDAVVIESADLPMREGAAIAIAARDPLGRRIRWQSRITVFTTPHPVVFGLEARFVDEQVAGPFAMWKHEHEFEAIDDATTRMVDRITYKPPLGALGFVIDWLYLRWKLRATLKHRGNALKQKLER